MVQRSRQEGSRPDQSAPLTATIRPLDYSVWSAEDRRKIIRELIAHEDKLTTERTQGLYTLQGFLFAALGIVINKGFPLPFELKLLITVIALTGLLSAALYLKEFLYNTKALLDLLDDWKRIERDYAANDPPKIIGYEERGKVRPMGTGWLTRKMVPKNLMLVWAFVLALVWLSDRLR